MSRTKSDCFIPWGREKARGLPRAWGSTPVHLWNLSVRRLKMWSGCIVLADTITTVCLRMRVYVRERYSLELGIHLDREMVWDLGTPHFNSVPIIVLEFFFVVFLLQFLSYTV